MEGNGSDRRDVGVYLRLHGATTQNTDIFLYFFHFCFAFMFGDFGVKESFCLYYVFIPAFPWTAYLQFLVSWTSLSGLVFVGMVHSVVRDLNAVRILNVFPDSVDLKILPCSSTSNQVTSNCCRASSNTLIGKSP